MSEKFLGAAINISDWNDHMINELTFWLGQQGYKQLWRVSLGRTLCVYNSGEYAIWENLTCKDVAAQFKFTGYGSLEAFKAVVPKFESEVEPRPTVGVYRKEYKLYCDDASHKYLIPVDEFNSVSATLEKAYKAEDWDTYEDVLSKYKLLEGQGYTVILDEET